ncbi:TPA: XRE family transcriptional regulator [Vibrio parahaemolyticus]
MKTSALGQRIERLRTERKLTKKSLAKILNVSGTTIGQWEKGEIIPRDDKIERLAQYFDVSFEWLRVGIDKELLVNKLKGQAILIKPYASNLPDLIFDLRELPQEHSDCLVYVKMDGDSGGDVLPVGCTIIIDTKDNNIKDGKIYLLEYQSYLTVRKLSFTSTGVRLLPLELMKGKEEVVTFQTLSQMNIIGRVIMSSSYR